MDIFSSLLGSSNAPEGNRMEASISFLGGTMQGVTASTLSFGDRLAEAVERQGSGRIGLNGAAPVKEMLSRQELMQLRDTLEQHGLPKSISRALNGLADSTGNSSLTQVMGKLRQQITGGEAQTLSGAEGNAARQLLQKLGFTSNETEELMGAMAEGESPAVWREIMNRISQADKGDFFSVTADEVGALAKGLGLPEGLTQALQQMFGSGEIDANSDALKQLFASVSQEMTTREQALKQINSALGESMGEIMAKLRGQDTRGAQADNRGSKQAELSEAMIRESVTGKGEDAPALGLGERGRGGSFAGKDDKDGQHNPGASFAARKDGSGRGSAWDTLLSRVSVSADSMVNGLQQGQSHVQAQANAAGRGTTPYLSEQAAQQVEKAILTNMHDGAKQLALKLNPPELGALTVTLLVRNNEISAVLKADQPETAQLLSEQMQNLRQSLEEQGIKVAKLDVQTELQNDPQQESWQGMEQHNASQQEQARSEERERFQRLRRLREADAEALAQDMLIPGIPEKNASGLNLVA